jgi:hypothetical protein
MMLRRVASSGEVSHPFAKSAKGWGNDGYSSSRFDSRPDPWHLLFEKLTVASVGPGIVARGEFSAVLGAGVVVEPEFD